MTAARCRWCGKYGARPVTRTIQNWRASSWHTVRQDLCPDCEQSWTADLPWNREPDYSLPVEER
jgi:hypothetical protein